MKVNLCFNFNFAAPDVFDYATRDFLDIDAGAIDVLKETDPVLQQGALQWGKCMLKASYKPKVC